MADTIRTLAELNAQFADNTSAVIAPQDIRDLMLSLMVYGEIGSGAKAAITLGTGFQAMDFTLAGVVGRGLTIDTTNKWIAGVPVAMKAKVRLEVSFSGTNNTTFDFAVFRNPDGTPEQLLRVTDSDRIVSAAMMGGVTIEAAIQLNAGDKLQAGVRANGASFTLLRGRLYVERIAVE
jgi:hypothetical protein